MWTEIFKAGLHTDSAGNERQWDRSDLDSIAAQYDPKEHEAPVVIGHPKDNSPAYGWVEALQRQGESLWAKLKLVPEFLEMVKNGLYKKRSIALYPGLQLRHVGFLGAMPPAVKGLKDIQFGDEENVIWIEEPLITEKTFSEEDVRSLIAQARKEGEEAAKILLTHHFQEELSHMETAEKNREIRRFIDEKIKDGIIPPAFVELGLCEFMESLDGSKEIEFAEGVRKPPLVWFKAFIEFMKPFPIFGEIASKRRVAPVGAEAEISLGKSIADKA
jgi:hypothetical protein